jgi:hypothetical protein
VFWNVMQPPQDLADAFAALYRRVPPDLAFVPWARPALEVYSGMFAKAAGGMREASVFGEPEEWRFGWEQSCARDEWLDQVPAFGGHSQFPPAKQQELLAGIGAAVDAVGGSFMLHYTTVAVTVCAGTQEPARR